jgi:zinc/manganese transport system substrate-binding protein
MTWQRMLKGAAVGVAVALTAAACQGSGSSGSSLQAPGTTAKTLTIVAGENFWGSIVSQLAGRAGQVTSVVSDPNADPHEYEASSNNARAFATADYVVLNGAGYDTWADKLLAGNPNPKRKVTVVADVLGKKVGDNPHFWYNPDYLTKTSDKIEADLKALDPADSSYFDAQRRTFDGASQPYRAELAAIKARFVATPVGATESILVYLANYLGLNLISPPAFMQAVSAGNDPPAATVAAFQDQINGKQIKVLVYNLQTATAVTSNLVKLAAQNSIPTVGITETIEPANATFEQWMATQLAKLQNALQAGS